MDIERHKKLNQKIVIVDGFIGGGKGMLSPILAAMPNVEMWLHRPLWESICQMHYLDKISVDAASAYFQLASDYDIYQLQLGRELNARPSDVTGLFKSGKLFQYLKRLFNSNDGDIIANKILSEKPVLNIMTHTISASSYPLFQAFGEKLTFIRLVRSPANDYMLRHLMNWTERWSDNHLRSISITYTKDSSNSTDSIPYIVKGKEDEYLGNNKIGKAILLLSEWQSNGDRVIDSMNKESQSTIIEVPFEKFVFNPRYYVDTIAKSLGTLVDKRTVRAMNKQKVPRKSLTDAPENKYYRKQGWVPPPVGENLTLEDEFNKGIEFAISSGASKISLDLLEELQSNYLQRYKILE